MGVASVAMVQAVLLVIAAYQNASPEFINLTIAFVTAVAYLGATRQLSVILTRAYGIGRAHHDRGLLRFSGDFDAAGASVHRRNGDFVPCRRHRGYALCRTSLICASLWVPCITTIICSASAPTRLGLILHSHPGDLLSRSIVTLVSALAPVLGGTVVIIFHRWQMYTLTDLRDARADLAAKVAERTHAL